MGYLPALCATWSAATQELCDQSPLGTSVQTAHVFYVSTEGIRTQQYSRLLHTTLLMSNVMLDKMTSEVHFTLNSKPNRKINQVILVQFATTDSDTRINKLVRCAGIGQGRQLG